MVLDNLSTPGTTAQKQNWAFFTDGVMGGLSQGKAIISNVDGIDCYHMTGNVTTENNGGFIQFRTKIKNHPRNKSFKGVRLRIRGNNHEYAVHLRTKYLLLPWQYYNATFQATDQWMTIAVSYTHLTLPTTD